MGKLISKLTEPIEYARGSVSQIITHRKRKRIECDKSNQEAEALEKALHSPKRKKLQTTSKYIYQTLFKEQKSSDVAVMAMGKVWNLHKVYLCQSPYFSSMFSGSWRESCQDFIHIKILDPKITIDSLDIVFGSLYRDEINIEPIAVISVLATATLFQLEGIIDTCSEIMAETMNAETAVPYYEAASQYGLKNIKKASFKWLLLNLLSFYSKHPKWLRLINIDLMMDLVGHQDLYVLQTEFSLYILLRLWVYLQLFPEFDVENALPTKDDKNISTNPHTYFSVRKENTPFLENSEGLAFKKVFQRLRLQHLLVHHFDLKIILDDNIIPKEWLHNHILNHWNTILKIDQILENGPKEVDEKMFYKNCFRCGRILPENGYQKWRWTGFNFGLDLVLMADGRTISIKRHHRAEHERLLSLQVKRQFMIRISVATLNEQRQAVHIQKTGIKTLNLEKNEEISLMILEKELIHPLLISVNLLVVTPENNVSSTNCEELLSNTNNKQVPISEIGAIASETVNNNPNAGTSSSAVS